MIRSFVINKYLSKEFCKVIINTILIFCCLGFIINLFEEINYFKDLDVKIYLPIILSLSPDNTFRRNRPSNFFFQFFGVKNSHFGLNRFLAVYPVFP